MRWPATPGRDPRRPSRADGEALRIAGGGRIRWVDPHAGGRARQDARPALTAAELADEATRDDALVRLAGIWLEAAAGGKVDVAAPAEERLRLASVVRVLEGADPRLALDHREGHRRAWSRWRPVLESAAAFPAQRLVDGMAARRARPTSGRVREGKMQVGGTVMAGALLAGLAICIVAGILGSGDDPAARLPSGVVALACWARDAGPDYDVVQSLSLLAAVSVGFGIAQSVEDAAGRAAGRRTSGATFVAASFWVHAATAATAMGHLAFALSWVPLGRQPEVSDIAGMLFSLLVASLAGAFVWMLGLLPGERQRRRRVAEARRSDLLAQLRALRGTVPSRPMLELSVLLMSVGIDLLVAGGVGTALARRGHLSAVGIGAGDAGALAEMLSWCIAAALCCGAMPWAAPAPRGRSQSLMDWVPVVRCALLSTGLTWVVLSAVGLSIIDGMPAVGALPRALLDGAAALIALILAGAVPWMSVRRLVRLVREGHTLTPKQDRRAVARELRLALRQLAEGEAAERESELASDVGRDQA